MTTYEVQAASGYRPVGGEWLYAVYQLGGWSGKKRIKEMGTVWAATGERAVEKARELVKVRRFTVDEPGAK